MANIICLNEKEEGKGDVIWSKFIGDNWTNQLTYDEEERRIVNEAPLKLKLLTESLSLLKKAFFVEKHASVFTENFYNKLLGAIQMNLQNIGVFSPIHNYVQNLTNIENENERIAAIEEFSPLFSQAVLASMEILEGMDPDSIDPSLPHLEGVGLFRLQSCMNHSCSPNAEMIKTPNDVDARARVVALRDIEVGEEVTICYLDDDPDNIHTAIRQLKLQAQYLFQCQCPKCRPQRGNKK